MERESVCLQAYTTWAVSIFRVPYECMEFVARNSEEIPNLLSFIIIKSLLI